MSKCCECGKEVAAGKVCHVAIVKTDQSCEEARVLLDGPDVDYTEGLPEGLQGKTVVRGEEWCDICAFIHLVPEPEYFER